MADDQHLPATTQRKSVTAVMAERYGMDTDAFERTVRATCSPKDVVLTKEQFAAGMVVANEYNLNLLTREIFFFPSKGGGVIPIVSIDGWARIINEHKAMNGVRFDFERKDEKLIAITCHLFRKDREHPTSVPEYLDECRRDTDPWKKWPTRMLRHKALIQCARIAFGFAGIYDQDEAERIIEGESVTLERIDEPEANNAPSGFIRGAEAKALIAEIEEEMAGARTLQELQAVFDDAMKYKGRISNNKIYALEHMRDGHETRIEKGEARAADQGQADIVLAALDKAPTFEELKRALQEASTDQQLAAWVAKLTPDVLATLPEDERNDLRAAYKARQTERAAMVAAPPAAGDQGSLTITQPVAGTSSELAPENPTEGVNAAEVDQATPAPASAAHKLPPEPKATDDEKARDHQFAVFKKNVNNALNRTRLMEVQTLFYKSEWYLNAHESEQEEAKQIVMAKLRALKAAA